MTFEHLNLRIDDRIAVVQMNRPAARNALSQALMSELLLCARELADRVDIDVVLLTGDERCFSAGADLKDERAWADESMSLVARRQIASLGYRMCKAWEEMPQITIAVIEGLRHRGRPGAGPCLRLACGG